MGALQFTDIHVLATLSFFDIYKAKGASMENDIKDEYAKQLEKRSKDMLSYVSCNCVERPKPDESKSMEEQVADMIKVFKVKNLYNTGMSFAKTPNYKEMIRDSRAKLISVFGSTPRLNGMSKVSWNDILHFQENSKLNK